MIAFLRLQYCRWRVRRLREKLDEALHDELHARMAYHTQRRLERGKV